MSVSQQSIIYENALIMGLNWEFEQNEQQRIMSRCRDDGLRPSTLWEWEARGKDLLETRQGTKMSNHV